jgi:hypothetical protein
VAKSPCGGSPLLWQHHKIGETLGPTQQLKKTRFYSLWSNKMLLWIVLHSSRPKALGVDNYKLFDFYCISLGD